MSAQVYVMKQGNLVKIGFSNNPKRRRNALSRKSAAVTIERAYSVSHHLTVESVAHALLADKREHGEWFNASVEEAAEAIETAVRTINAQFTDYVPPEEVSVTLTLKPDEAALLERLAAEHGGKKAAVIAGLHALARRNELTREELLAEIVRRLT